MGRCVPLLNKYNDFQLIQISDGERFTPNSQPIGKILDKISHKISRIKILSVA